MSKLDYLVRPLVQFDPANKLHRQYFTKFLETGSWRGCPVRFCVDDDHGMLMGAIQRKLILWYAEQEHKGKLATAKLPRGRKILGKTSNGIEIGLLN